MPKQTFVNIPVEKQENIIQVGEQLFSEYFYEHVDVRMIVNACKIPRGSFYAYFQNIEDYYFTVIEALQKKRVERIQKITSDDALDYFTVLKEIYEQDIRLSLFQSQNLLAQHYFRYLLSHRLGYCHSDQYSQEPPIFQLLSKYQSQFLYTDVEWRNFVEFCMNTVLETYIKTVEEKWDYSESIRCFELRLDILRKGSNTI